jgi:alanine-alpha-ketoisovalerate/valine-pyruvate aminotransferase
MTRQTETEERMSSSKDKRETAIHTASVILGSMYAVDDICRGQLRELAEEVAKDFYWRRVDWRSKMVEAIYEGALERADDIVDSWRDFDDGQPDERQEWHDFDPDC